MTLAIVSRTFFPDNMGGYDISGTYFAPATAVVTNGIETEDVFAVFDPSTSYYASTLMNARFDLNFTLSNADYLQTQPINVKFGSFDNADDQDAITSDKTNPGNTKELGSSGIGGGDGNLVAVAGNFYILHADGYGDADIKGGSHDFTLDEGTYSQLTSPYGLLASFQAGDFPSNSGTSGGYFGLTTVSNVSLTVIGTIYTNVPVISRTVANQTSLDDITSSPFATVTLSDPSNPIGVGDTITIVITDAKGTATDSLGTLSLPNAGDMKYLSAGTYRLSAPNDTGLAGLQADLKSIVYTPDSVGDVGSAATAHFALNYLAIDGTPARDTTTSVVLSHDLRTITLSGATNGTDRTPFAALQGLAVSDPYSNDQVGATITVQTGTGTLSGSGLTQNADGTYVLAATSVATLNTELQGLLFTATPALVSPGSTSRAEISITASAGDGWLGYGAESVVVTAVSVAPAITGSSTIRIKAGDTTRPFTRAVLTDGNNNSSDTLTIQLSNGRSSGTLSGAGLFGEPDGTYKLFGTADQITAALEGLAFNSVRGAPNSAVTTTFTLSDTTAFGTSTTSASFAVTANTDPVNPTITGSAALTVQSEAASTPFVTTVVSDPNTNSTDTLTIQQTGNSANGTLSGSGLVAGASGSYSLTGTGVAITTALQALVFTPAQGTPGGSVTTSFTLTDRTSIGLSAANKSFSITNIDPAVAPTVAGSATTRVQSEAVSTPFATASVTDPNLASTETLTIQLSSGGTTGVLAGTGLTGGTGGSYTLAGTAAAITAALQALTFTPGKGTAGSSVTTNFRLTNTTSFGTQATLAFSVVDTDPIVATGAVLNTGSVSGAAIDATGPGTHTVVVGSGSQDTITYGSGAGTASGTGNGDTIIAGNGTISVSGFGGGTTASLGDGNNVVNLAAAGSFNVVTVGNGNNRIAAGNGGGEQVKAGNGTNVISAGGASDVVLAGNGANTVTMTGSESTITTGSGNDTIVITGVGGAKIMAGLGTNKISFAGVGNTVVNQGGTDNLTDNGSGNTIVLPSAGAGLVTVGANALTNGDTFDLRAAMAATAWDHQTSDIGAYLLVGNQGGNAIVSIDPSGVPGGLASTVAVITGASPISLSDFLPHTLT